MPERSPWFVTRRRFKREVALRKATARQGHDRRGIAQPEGTDVTRCIGFGAREGVCENEAGGPPRDNPVWCGACDTARIAYLSAQFDKISAGFSRPANSQSVPRP